MAVVTKAEMFASPATVDRCSLVKIQHGPPELQAALLLYLSPGDQAPSWTLS